MALSNMRIEPRREITESAIGIAALFVIIPVLVLGGVWFQYFTGGPFSIRTMNGDYCPWPLGILIVVCSLFLTTLLIWGLNHLTHYIGEKICDGMARIGWDPRPKQRYEKRQVYVPGKNKYIETSVPVQS